MLQRYLYGPWGERIEGDFAKLRFGYTGHSNESATGHWGALHRYLDPRAARWTQRDPLGAMDGINRYAYARNAAVSSTDPSGLLSFEGPFPAGYSKERMERIQSELIQSLSSTNDCYPLEFISPTTGKPCSCTICRKVDYLGYLKGTDFSVSFDKTASWTSKTAEAVTNGLTGNIKLYPYGYQGASDAKIKQLLLHEMTHIPGGYTGDHGDIFFIWLAYQPEWSGVSLPTSGWNRTDHDKELACQVYKDWDYWFDNRFWFQPNP